jgi:hypothetical protein
MEKVQGGNIFKGLFLMKKNFKIKNWLIFQKVDSKASRLYVGHCWGEYFLKVV